MALNRTLWKDRRKCILELFKEVLDSMYSVRERKMAMEFTEIGTWKEDEVWRRQMTNVTMDMLPFL